MVEQSIPDNVGQVYSRIRAAAARAGRSADDVLLIAISKTQPVEAIRRAVDAGIRCLGENRVQEAKQKIEEYGKPVPWHMVGHLQSNKARDAVRLFDLIHSVDRSSVVKALSKAAERFDTSVEVLIQVNVSGEESKFGCDPEEAEGLIERCAMSGRIQPVGLMTIPPWPEEPEESRPYCVALRELRDRLRARGHELHHLSMGMTDDFEVAVEEGATMVRVGRAIFGQRQG